MATESDIENMIKVSEAWCRVYVSLCHLGVIGKETQKEFARALSDFEAAKAHYRSYLKERATARLVDGGVVDGN